MRLQKIKISEKGGTTMKTKLFIFLLFMLPTCVFAQSTSPNPQPVPDTLLLPMVRLQAALVLRPRSSERLGGNLESAKMVLY